MAQPFDAKSLTIKGEAVPVAEAIADDQVTDRGFFAVSDKGTLIFQSGGHADRALAWVDRTGKRLATVGDPGRIGRIFLSPDGKRATVSVASAAGDYDLWIYDLVRNLRSRFTFDPANEPDGLWSPDCSQIVFSSNRRGHADLYRKPASGAGPEELLYADDLDKTPESWSPDGRFVIYSAVDPKTPVDLWVLPLEGQRKPFLFQHNGFNELRGQFSPDGHWVAYQSIESGRLEIYIAPFPGPGGKRLVSVSGGVLARWRRDGKRAVLYCAR